MITNYHVRKTGVDGKPKNGQINIQKRVDKLEQIQNEIQHKKNRRNKINFG